MHSVHRERAKSYHNVNIQALYNSSLAPPTCPPPVPPHPLHCWSDQCHELMMRTHVAGNIPRRLGCDAISPC